MYPTQISQWKKQLLDSASSVFEGKHANTEASVDVDALYRKIGRLEMERDFLASRPGVAISMEGQEEPSTTFSSSDCGAHSNTTTSI